MQIKEFFTKKRQLPIALLKRASVAYLLLTIIAILQHSSLYFGRDLWTADFWVGVTIFILNAPMEVYLGVMAVIVMPFYGTENLFFTAILLLHIATLIITPYIFRKIYRSMIRIFISFGWMLMWITLFISRHTSERHIFDSYKRHDRAMDVAGFPFEAFYYPVCCCCGDDIPPVEQWLPFFGNIFFWIAVMVFVGYFVAKKYFTIRHYRFWIILSIMITLIGSGFLLSVFD